ncbi:leucine-rich repeat domain-containing protein [Capnocytophaga sputigena]
MKESAFENCEALYGVTLPNTINTIEQKAFFKCKGLKSISLSDNIISIGKLAFSESGIENITLPLKLTYINAQAFYKCDNLISVTIEKNVTRIGSQAFSLCPKLSTITCKATTAPILVGTNVFYKYSGDNIKVYVPTESSPNWGWRGSSGIEIKEIP